MAKYTADRRPENKNTYRNTSSNYLNKYYQHSSMAYDIYPEEEEEEIRYAPPQKKGRQLSRKERIRLIKKRNSPQYVYEGRAERKISGSAIITVAIMFLGALAYVFTLSLTASAQANIVTLEAQLKAVQDDNYYAQSNMLENLDMEKIENIAKNKLGMAAPGDHQKVYIDTQSIEQSYFVRNNTAKAESNPPAISLSNFFDYFESN